MNEQTFRTQADQTNGLNANNLVRNRLKAVMRCTFTEANEVNEELAGSSFPSLPSVPSREAGPFRECEHPVCVGGNFEPGAAPNRRPALRLRGRCFLQTCLWEPGSAAGVGLVSRHGA